MKIIKEYWVHDGKHYASIRTNTYCKTLSHVLLMWQQAYRDYPSIHKDMVNVVVYGGDRIKGIMGLEFPIEKPTKDYAKIHQPEYLLN